MEEWKESLFVYYNVVKVWLFKKLINNKVKARCPVDICVLYAN